MSHKKEKAATTTQQKFLCLGKLTEEQNESVSCTTTMSSLTDIKIFLDNWDGSKGIDELVAQAKQIQKAKIEEAEEANKTKIEEVKEEFLQSFVEKSTSFKKQMIVISKR